MKTKEQAREDLIRRCHRIEREIDQIERDIASWNETHPDAEPIEVDPDGELAESRAIIATIRRDLK